MEKEVLEYVATCPVCAQDKTSTRAQTGLLHPLPVPQHPWSHISMDFVTGLPPTRGNTSILTVVDRFSKMAHFIPLAKLPSAKKTAEVMMSHVFKVHGFPSDIVSDRGPQFVSRFWKEFCQLIGATVSMSSGYHPQSNGQTERLNQGLETCLRCLVSQNQDGGVTTSPGWNTPTTPFLRLPQVCHPSSAPMGTSPPCSRPMKWRSRFPQPTPWSDAAARFGRRPAFGPDESSG